MKRIVITGSRGFIGKALTSVLKSQKNQVYPIDRSLLYDSLALTYYLEQLKPHYIYHLAAYGNHSSQQDDEETFKANVISTFNLATATKNIPYEAFINFGSSSEYGKKKLPMREEDLVEPETMYGATKAASTYILRGFSKKYDKPIVTVRPFSVYGPGEADFRFIPTAIRCGIQDTELSLDVTGVHDWIYIDDFTSAVIKVAEKANVLAGNVVNIGTGHQFTNEQVILHLVSILGKGIKTKKNYGMRPQDSAMWMANINTLKLLGWKPQYPLLLGLSNTYNYYKTKYETN